jgi:hypothetical protein
MGSGRNDYAPKKPLISAPWSQPSVPAASSSANPCGRRGPEQRRARHSSYLSVLATLPPETSSGGTLRAKRSLHLYNSYRFREPQPHLSTGSLRLSTALR